MKIVIPRNVWLSMVSSILDVYRKEALGYLVGERQGQTLRAAYISTTQRTKKRTTHEAEEREDTYSRALQVAQMAGMSLLGDFHSHPESHGFKYSCAPSRSDIASLRQEPRGWVSLVVAISGHPPDRLELTLGCWRINSKNALVLVPGKVLG